MQWFHLFSHDLHGAYLVCRSLNKTARNYYGPSSQLPYQRWGLYHLLDTTIYGSVDFQGLGIPELYHSGYATQIELLIDNLWKSTQTGHFLQMAIQEFILEAGSMLHPLLPLSDSCLDSWLLTQRHGLQQPSYTT